MANITLKTTRFVLDVLDKFLKFNIKVEGLENLEDNPTLFVVNHFTRIETFILPYVIYKHTGKQVHSLAHSSLFVGQFGKYLKSLGAVSTREPLRNRRIIGDLISGKNNWVIYPEGVMVKNKKNIPKKKLQMNLPAGKGFPHTGAAVLALKADLYKRDYLNALKNNDAIKIDYYQERFNIKKEDISILNTIIIPVNITYYPIRPGKNLISNLATAIFKNIPPMLEEELEIESQLLFGNTDMTIYYGKPIWIDQYLDLPFNLTLNSFLSKEKKNNLLIWIQRYRLTNNFMRQIYTRTAINIDHLFCMGLRKLKSSTIQEEAFYRALFLSSLEIKKIENRYLHSSIQSELIKIITDEHYPPIEDIRQLAEEEKMLERKDAVYHINRSLLKKKYPIYNIRIKNTIQVIANELEPLKKTVKIIQKNVNSSMSSLKDKIVKKVYQKDLDDFERDYELYYDDLQSKSPSVGSPFFLKSKSKSLGVVISHGYLAAPEEVRLLANFLYEKGYSVYGARLKGHGTSPRQILDVTWQDWVSSFQCGYAVVKNYCKEVVLCGFSCGGLIASLSAAKKKRGVNGLVCINTPLVLSDIRTHLVPACLVWNELADKFKAPKAKLEYVANPSESPGINYSINYLKGVRELELLINECRKNLKNVNVPTLIIQGDSDPVVDPKSADIIFSSISSKDKELALMNFQRHIIIRKQKREIVFEKIVKFIKEKCLK